MLCRQFIAVMNDLNRAPAAFAKTSDLVERQGGMATIDVADYIRVGFEHDVGVDQSRTGDRGASLARYVAM
jgi:hypothetical protein